ncbi:hypothetical protein, variant [Aphanomyces invadans]|uniref:Uncharacterized protein n=1 Tax=Aphanomyces invadans TaxID=157072 RepID=A0A024TN57_9STRA|nr:hypothetical protein, variant [Aphanomyces invadans]ETV95404.1 hypothetical protein, variant [Aphanomyces invadans]|eukprot:XP_008876105.1 hypothetical protein, variant [Aphanomyces invadans]
MAEAAPPRFVTNPPKLAQDIHTPLGTACRAVVAHVQEQCPGLVATIQTFLDTTLSEAIQERETKYVNTMSDVFKQELKTRNDTAQRLMQKCAALETRMAEADAVTTMLHSKLDRRTYEMDNLRKMHYKELLLLREMVAKHRTDARTLKALDDALGRSNNDADDGDEANFGGRGGRSSSIVTPSTDGRLEAMKLDLEKRKKFSDGLRDERDKWQQKAIEAMEQVEALKDLIRKRENSPNAGGGSGSGMSDAYLTAWWYGGAESGLRERQAIESAVSARHITYDEVAGSVVEVLASPDLWASLGTLAQQAPLTPAVRGLMAHLSQLGEFTLRKSPSTAFSARSDDTHRQDDDKPDVAGSVHAKPNAIACVKCHGTGYVEPNAAQKDEENERIKALQKSVEGLRKDLRAEQTRVIELETTRDELENAKRALVAKLGEFQTSLNAVQAQAAADAQARADEALARSSQMHHAACQTDAIKVTKPPPASSTTSSSPSRHPVSPTPSSTSPTDAELGMLNRSGLEDLVAEKCAIIGELQLTRQTQSDQLDDLKRQVQAAAENMVAFNRASESAQQLLRQEITVLRDTITNIQDTSSASIRERQASLSAYLTKMKTDHMKAVLLKAPPDNNAGDAAMKSATEREVVAIANQQLEHDITKLIPWSDSDVQTESLAQATAQAASRAEAELDNLPIGFIHEDEAADVDAAQRLSLTTDSRPHELVDTIQAMAAELEAAKASARKLQTVQLQRIVTLSTHLSKVASELLLLRKKSGAEVAFWKTECEKLDRELLCLVTEFNLYKSNHMIDGERQVMQSLLTADHETLWGQDGPEARAFLATMREACATSPVNPMVAKFLVLGEAIHSLAEGCARPFHALKAIYDGWRDGGGGSSTPRKAPSKKRTKSKVVGHGSSSTSLADMASSPSPSKSPSKRASALASLPGAPPPSPKQSSSPTKRRRSSASSKPRLLSARIPTGDAALALDSTSPTSPELDHGALSTADDRDKSLPRAFELTAVDEVTEVEASNQSPHDIAMVPDDIHVPTAPLDNTLLLIEGDSPLSTATALQNHARLQVTTQDTPPASAMAQATIPLESQDENNNPPVHDDGRFLDSLHAPNPAEQNPKELQYLKSLAGNRTDTLRSLAMTQWEVLVLQLQLLALHARTVEMKERRVRFNRPHVAMSSMAELLHQGIHRREIALADCHQRHERLRERLKHVNLCIIHAISTMFQPSDRTDTRTGRHGMSGRQRYKLLWLRY